MSENPALQNYKELLSRIDGKFLEIRSRNEESFACRSGCHGCCKPDLTVNSLEAEHIRSHLESQPELRKEVLELEEAGPHQGLRCRFLRANGSCSIYEVRPVVCRSHGAPLKVRVKEQGQGQGVLRKDVCPLNFQDRVLEELPSVDFLDLDTLNTLLTVIQQQYRREEEQIRTPLSASAILRRD